MRGGAIFNHASFRSFACLIDRERGEADAKGFINVFPNLPALLALFALSKLPKLSIVAIARGGQDIGCRFRGFRIVVNYVKKNSSR